MRNGENGAPLGGAAQRFEHPRLGLRVKIRRDLVEKKHGGVCRRGAGDGEKLPLALREQAVRACRAVALRQRFNGRVDAGEPCGIFCHLFRNARIAERDLVENGPRHAGEMLLDAADAGAPFAVGNLRYIPAADGDAAALRRIEPEQQLENGALSCARPADERYLLALLHGHGKI